jgi:hypothetical protein
MQANGIRYTGMLTLTISIAATIDDRPSMEPTDRSMPAARMTIVSPTARMPRVANPVIALLMFCEFQNVWPLLMMPNATTRISPI